MATTKNPHLRPHYPSNLRLFAECRRHYLFKVVERRGVDEPFSTALAKGKIVHDVLKICATQLMHDAPSLPANLYALVEPRLPREQYPSALTWKSDVEEVVRWLKYALSYLDSNAIVVGAELFLSREFAGDDACAGFPIGAVLDLVLLRRDLEDEPYLEVVDYKSGRSGWEDPLAPIIARFVLKGLISRHLPAGRFGRVVYTELFLAERTPRFLELELQLCLERWEEVKLRVAEIAREEEFPPFPSPRCRFCPYNGNGCLAGFSEPEDDGELW